MYNKRRSRSRRSFHQNRRHARSSLAPIVMVLCLSVACGYATAKYVVEPVVNYVPQISEKISQDDDSDTSGKESVKDPAAEKSSAENDEKNDEKRETVVEDEAKVEHKGKIKGYALQYGCYSSRAAAETAAGTIGKDDIEVTEQNDMYKVLGKTYDTKDEAKNALNDLADPSEAFVAPVYEN